MCGRTACTLAPDELCKACSNKNFRVEWRDEPGSQHNYSPSYNAAPTSHTPVIYSGKHLKSLTKETQVESEFVMQPMMWSLIPHFYKGESAKQHGYKTNNCRVETIEQKQMFSHLLKKGQRCVVLCDGFYEWQTKDKVKTPYLIYAPQPEHIKIWDRSSWENIDVVKSSDVKTKIEEPENTSSESCEKQSSDWHGPVPLKMAGLFSKWKSTEDEEVWSYTVLTTEAGKGFNWLHHRVPVMLQSDDMVKMWLDPDIPYSSFKDQITGSPDLKWHVVSDEVNNSRNNSVLCMKPAEVNNSSKKPSGNKLMMSWLSKGSKKTEGDNATSKRKSSNGSQDANDVKKPKLGSEKE